MCKQNCLYCVTIKHINTVKTRMADGFLQLHADKTEAIYTLCAVTRRWREASILSLHLLNLHRQNINITKSQTAFIFFFFFNVQCQRFFTVLFLHDLPLTATVLSRLGKDCSSNITSLIGLRFDTHHET